MTLHKVGILSQQQLCDSIQTRIVSIYFVPTQECPSIRTISRRLLDGKERGQMEVVYILCQRVSAVGEKGPDS
jgi:hypothetical protein